MTEVDIKNLDALYKSFPQFEEWNQTSVDLARWSKYEGRLREVSDSTSDTLDRALSIVRRTAAIETGAIEGLYEIDRGFTITVATQAALWEAALSAKGEETKSLIDSQIRAYDYVLDFATKREKINEAWIRELHKQICGSQSDYLVHTTIGVQRQPLPLGEYKHLPNHVRKQDGTFHSYCPVDLTPAEMHRLVEELRSSAFERAHPAVQASYAHYALVVIHPFADGNGRVARALASSFTTRAISVPLLILAEDRKSYLEALQAADVGDYASFVDFVFERCVDAIQLVVESLKAAALPEPEEILRRLDKLYVTRGGFTHAQVDQAGDSLLNALGAEIQALLSLYERQGQFAISNHWSTGSYALQRKGSRLPITNQGRILNVTLTSVEPARAQVTKRFAVELPVDCDEEDEMLVRDLESGGEFGARIREIIPNITGALQMRLRVFAEKILREGIVRLVSEAADARNARIV